MSSTSLFKWMGLGQTGKNVAEDECDEGERYFGLENFGNTCYSNSVIQALYYCKPFRECVTNFPVPMSTLLPPSVNNTPYTPNAGQAQSYFPTTTSNGQHTSVATSSASTPSRGSISNGSGAPLQKNSSRGPTAGILSASGEKDQNSELNLAPGMEDTLFAALKDLFWKIATHRKKTGVVAPVNFINKVKKENELFRSSMHQDAHEFLNYTLNTIAEDVQKYQKKMAIDMEKPLSGDSIDSTGHESIKSENTQSNSAETSTSDRSEASSADTKSTWVHQLFEGVFSNETKCLTCETVTSRDECFMDLSIDVEMNSSITSCLRQFSASETMCHKNKYFCDACCGLQEAERRMKIKKPPNILALHLKRFKYQEQLQKYIKLTYRVVFPFELRLFNTCDDTEDADRMYELWACVIHIGSGPHHGHYVTIIKSNGEWKLFDDDEVTNIKEEEIQKYFSDLPGSGSGYVLFYQAVNLNTDSIHGWNPVEAKGRPLEETKDSSGGPAAVPNHLSFSTPTSTPLRLDPVSLFSGRAEEPTTPDLSAGSPMSPRTEEKKYRWGLGRKIREKKERKH